MRRLVPVLAAMMALAVPTTAGASLLFDEDFTGPTTDVPFRVGGSADPCLTASQDTSQTPIPGCPTGQPSLPPGGDPDGSGTLRLTDNSDHRSSYAIYDRGLPFTAGVEFTFDAFAYNGSIIPGFPDHGADGMSVFIKDAAVRDERPGAFGGSLGYAQSNDDFDSPYTAPATIPGVPGGYFGVGIDEFGNFANDREARGFGCQDRADRNLHPNTVSLRGRGLPGTDWLEGYCLRESATAPESLDRVNALLRTDPGVAHRYRIVVDPPAAPNARVRLLADFDLDGDFTPMLDVSQPPDPPDRFEFGFAASTGDATNIHEIRAVRVETIDPLPEFALTKTHEGALVAGRDGIFYVRASVRATGGPARAPLVINDTLPAGVTIRALPHGDGWDCAGTVLGSRHTRCVYDIDPDDPVPPGTHLPRLAVPVDLAPDLTGRHVNVAILTGPELLEPLEAEDPFVIRRLADLAVRKIARPEEAGIGEVVSFAVSVSNLGPSDAHQVTLVDRVPDGLTLLDIATAHGDCARAQNGFRCDLGTIVAGGSKLVTLTARTEAPAGIRVNRARADAVEEDPNPGNNEDEAPVRVDGPPAPTPELSITKRAGSHRVRVGQPLGYTVVVRNTGQVTAEDVVMMDSNSLPTKILKVTPSQGSCRAKGSSVTCHLGDIPVGETRTIRMKVRILRAGMARNSAVAIPGGSDGVIATENVRVVEGAALRITKVANRRRVPIGGTVRFRIKVRSVGSGTARNVRVCDRLPRGLRLAFPPSLQGKRRICWRVGNLRPGRSRSVRVIAYASAATGRAVNRATATASNAPAARASRPVTVFDTCPPNGLWDLSVRC
ncbi:MAG: DUF11 domain-containing protein [Solirubrobacterales bacterium]|nr:DUF11 domain-containing protein [Solirubrobacterales bacterium]